MQISEAIRDTRDHLGQTEDSLNRLNGAINNSQGTVTLEFATPLPSAGSLIEARSSTGSEIMYVWSISGQVATVQRGWADTTAQAFADDDVVAIDPVLPYAKVYRALTSELRSLPSEGLGQIKTGTVTLDLTREGYDLSSLTDLVQPLALHQTIGSRDYWSFDFVDHPDFLRPVSARGWATTDSGDATLHYRAELVQPTDHTSDLSTDCKVPESAQDVVAISAALRIVYSQEQLRGQMDVQTHARASEDVPPGSGTRSVALLAQWKATRLAHESRRIRERYPRRRT